MPKTNSRTKSVSVSPSETESNDVKVDPCIAICVGVLCVFIIMAATVLVAVTTGALGGPMENAGNKTWTRQNRKLERKFQIPLPNKQPDGAHVKFRFFAPPNSNEMSNYGLLEATDFCKQRNGRLPTPKSVDEEFEMIRDIKILHEEARCNRYAIGYKLDEKKRYSSLDQQKQWPSLRVDTAAGTDLNDRDCIEIEAGQNFVFKIVNSRPCKDVLNLEHIIYLKSVPEHCTRDMWGRECLFYSREQSGDVFEQVANTRINFPSGNVIGVLLLDREFIPRRLLEPNYYLFKSTWLFEVKYVLNYLNIYDSRLAPYKVNVTIFQDPEKDCLAVNALKKFQIETVLCSEDTGCPACESEPRM